MLPLRVQVEAQSEGPLQHSLPGRLEAAMPGRRQEHPLRTSTPPPPPHLGVRSEGSGIGIPPESVNGDPLPDRSLSDSTSRSLSPRCAESGYT